jgi:threonylcarbamoyladenosine tRNA methylthiotransferase MtaB
VELWGGVSIAADIIVGVPGETDEEFEKSCEFVRSVDVSYLHVFTYSERENTMAVKMPNQVPLGVRKERSKIMHQLAEEKQLIFQLQHLNTVRKVLFEAQQNGNVMYGFTDNYIKVEVPFNPELINDTKNVLLVSLTDDGNVLGKVIN